MDLTVVVQKLEEFGLQNFISAFGLPLCKKTVSPWLVALALKFNPDEIAIINYPPDDTSKCHKLYELIQKKCADNVGDFIEALRNTDNEHVIPFIQTKLADPTSASQIPSSSSSFTIETGIWFNIPEPIDSFCGREDFLNELHEKLQNQHLVTSASTEAAVAGPSRPKTKLTSTTSVTVLSQVKIVSGLAGIGKTETATQYIWNHRKSYNNFIWINAESESSMQNSFTKLAEELKVPVKDSKGKCREMNKILKDIYNNISNAGKSNLMVFDNAEDFQSCKNFFPISLHPDLKKPVILATSRNQTWTSRTGKIAVLPLGVLTESESLEFILTQLEVEDSPEFREESKELIQLIGGLPLALQQAVAYIKNEQELRECLGTCYNISDYVLEFKSSMKKFLSFCPHPDSSATVFATWNLTFEKIQSLENGAAAVRILELLSFFHADKIPNSFIHDVVPEIEDREFSQALKLIEKYSLIKMNAKDVCLSVHRQLQFVILQHLKESDKVSEVVMNLVDKCLDILENIKLSESTDIFLNIHQIVKNLFDFIPMTVKYLDFMYNFGSVLHHVSRYSESLNLFQKVHSKRRELQGENHPITLASQNNLALELLQLGSYGESLTLFRETLKQMEIHLGPDHPDTITAKHNMAMVLQDQEKYDEALELFQQILVQRKTIQGENHTETLNTLTGIAHVHSKLGDFLKALALYQDVEEKQIEILGTDHTDVLYTKHNKAILLYHMGEFQEASGIFNEVYEKRKELLGENHLDAIRTLSWIAVTLDEDGKFEEALQLYKKVHEIINTTLGENHPDTINVKNNIEIAERELQKTNSLSSD